MPPETVSLAVLALAWIIAGFVAMRHLASIEHPHKTTTGKDPHWSLVALAVLIWPIPLAVAYCALWLIDPERVRKKMYRRIKKRLGREPTPLEWKMALALLATQQRM